jgi:hypothetical protein
MKNWGEQNHMPWNAFFQKISKPRGIHMIRSGKISPWVLYNSKSGLKFLESLTAQETVMIEDYICPTSWTKRFNQSPTDVEFVHDIMKKANI